MCEHTTVCENVKSRYVRVKERYKSRFWNTEIRDDGMMIDNLKVE